MKTLLGQTVLITGAASGIGRAIAIKCATAGANVVASDIQVPEDTAKKVTALGGHCTSVCADVSRRDQVLEMIATAVRDFGGLDVLVCSAAIGFPDPILEVSDENWDHVLSVNLKGTFLSTQAALPVFLARQSGSILLIASIAGRRYSVTNGVHYTCSKYGIIGLTRHLAAELAGTGIRINCLCPGPTDTPLLARETTLEGKAEIARHTPLRRLAQPEDIADVAVFVVGPEARHMHGAIVDVNGGLY